MQTSVFREILDKSLPGEKIFGGEIDQVDKIIADEFQFPGTGSAVGSMDGFGIALGAISPLGTVSAQNIIADNNSSNGSNFTLKNATYDIFEAAAVFDQPRIRIRNGTTGNLTHLFHPINLNYIEPSLVVGGTSVINAAYKLQVNGSLIANDGYFSGFGGGVLLSSWYSSYLSLSSTVSSHTSTLSGYATNLWLLADAEVTSLATLDGIFISNTQWSYLGALDQNLSASSNVTFGSVASGILNGPASLDINALAGQVNIDGTSGLGVVISSVFDFNTNGSINYTAPGAGARLTSSFSGGQIRITKNNITGGISVDPNGDVSIGKFSGGSSGIGSTFYGEDANPGAAIIQAIADGLRFVSDPSANLIYCGVAGIGWQVDSVGKTTVQTGATGGFEIATNTTVGTPIRFIKTFSFTNVFPGTSGQSSVDFVAAGVEIDDCVILNIKRDPFAGSQEYVTFEAEVREPGKVRVWIIQDSGISAFSVSGIITVIGYYH